MPLKAVRQGAEHNRRAWGGRDRSATAPTTRRGTRGPAGKGRTQLKDNLAQ